MKRKPKLPVFLLTCLYFLCAGCDNPAPAKYFEISALNCNMMYGFAGDGMFRELESPSAKLVEGTKDQTAPMKRKEVIESKIKVIEDNFAKVKELPETPETRDILRASASLYEYVLPVYKNEYRQLAQLFDDGAAKGQVESLAEKIRHDHYSRFVILYNELISAAKAYTEIHHIKVNWDINPSPK